MAGKMISELSDATTLQSTDLIPLARGSSTLKLSGGNIALKADLESLSANPFIAADTSTIDLTLTNRTLSASVFDSSVTNSKLAFDGGSFAFRNKIINGDMRIDQRNAGASVTQQVALSYTLDRFAIQGTVASKFTAQQNQNSVTPPSGFSKYLGITSSSSYSVAAGDFFYIAQGIEGLNISNLRFGTVNASPITLSFWVRSSLTGTFGGSIRNNGTRSYPFTYTIPSANTWTLISITIPGDTTGTWASDNTAGMWVFWGLGAGSTLSGTAGSWQAGNLVSATGSTSVVGTNGTTFYITGVQLEEGSVATPFEHRPIGTELALCQRYYEKGYINGWELAIFSDYNQGYTMSYVYKVSKRSLPTLLTVGTQIINYRYQNSTRTNGSYEGSLSAGFLDHANLVMTLPDIPSQSNGFGTLASCEGFAVDSEL